MIEPPELEPHYYRDNFLDLSATVEAQYGDLLSEDESDFLCRFRQLSRDAQCLYVRLVSRVGPLFRLSKLDYPEIASVPDALGQLAANGLVSFPTELEVAHLGQLFTVAELRGLFPELPAQPPIRRKGELLEAIVLLSLEPAELLDRVGKPAGERILVPGGSETVALLQLLYFGNRRQNLTDFVLSDLGVARYYPYPLDRDQRMFATRAALEEYLFCEQLSDGFYELAVSEEGDEAGQLLELAQQMLSFLPTHASSERRWYRLCNRVARELERQGEMAPALTLYERSELHPARERRARILEHGQQWEAALSLCQEIIAQPHCEAERDAARRIMPRLQRQLGMNKIVRRESFPTETVRLQRSDMGVERAAGEYLARSWQAVYYVENKLMNGLFSLAFWEQIFAPVSGVFHNPYQSVPTDMYEPGFRQRRLHELEARLEVLRTVDLRQELLAAWQRYHTYQCRWMNWHLVSEDLVSQALAVIPGDHLQAIWQRMLFDPGENRRGFPDLLALGRAPGEYQMIEVKAPGDTLQNSQKRWLRFFLERGIGAGVLRVEWQDDGHNE